MKRAEREAARTRAAAIAAARFPEARQIIVTFYGREVIVEVWGDRGTGADLYMLDESLLAAEETQDDAAATADAEKAARRSAAARKAVETRRRRRAAVAA